MRNSFESALIGGAVLMIAAGTVFAQAPNRQNRSRPGDLRQPDRLKQGDMAPDFTLKSPAGKQKTTLSSYRGKKPVALVFGSYT